LNIRRQALKKWSHLRPDWLVWLHSESGWPDWANFRLLYQCFLVAVFWNLRY
jgi:hypothetical protein